MCVCVCVCVCGGLHIDHRGAESGGVFTSSVTEISCETIGAHTDHLPWLFVHTRTSIQAHLRGRAVDGLGDVRVAVLPSIVDCAAAFKAAGPVDARATIQAKRGRAVQTLVNIVGAPLSPPAFFANTHFPRFITVAVGNHKAAVYMLCVT